MSWSTTLFSAYKGSQDRELCDVTISPDVSSFGLLQWTAFEMIVKAGYRATRRVLQEEPELFSAIPRS